jgi:hypothetical protein
MTVKTYHDRLDPTWVAALELSLVGGSEFPWQYQPVEADQPWGQFTHTLYQRNEPSSPFIEMLQPVIELINPLAVNTAWVELFTSTTEYPQPRGWTVDHEDSRLTTALYCVNTTDAFWEFKDGTRVDSQAGTMITYPSSLENQLWTSINCPASVYIKLIHL